MKMKTMADIITTVTKDINEITKIKNDLNALLRENGIEGGPVFSTYPDKFRSLFRVLDGRTEESTWNLPVDSVSVITSVPKPVLVRRENSNTFYLYCANPDANIYYTIESEHYHIGERLYTAHGLLTITEDSYITAYAKIREIKSEPLSWWNVEHLAEDTPENPEFDRDGTTITITCSTEDAIIWYRVGEVGEFSQYTEPLTNVPRTNNVYAYSSNLSHQSSEIVVDEAPEKIKKPHTPEVSQDINEIIVTSDEDDVTLYWKKTTDTDWTEYSEGDEITESGYYISMAIRDGVQSEWSTPVELTFYPTPAVPTYQQNVNEIALQCSTAKAVIYYSFDDGETWIEYKKIFEIDEDKTMILKSVLGPVESDESEPIELTYIPKPATPEITCSNNTVTITCDTDEASIYYRINQEDEWRAYLVPFTINENIYVEAYARKDERDSDTASAECIFGLVTRPATPEITCRGNKVTIWTPTVGATIYYRVYGSSTWIEYEEPFSITQTDYYETYCIKDNKDSPKSSPILCQYVENPGPVPESPEIKYFNNIVTILPSPGTVNIEYATSGSSAWGVYSSPFSISSSRTIVARCVNAYGESDQVYKYCKYVPYPLSVPVITCSDNCVYISTPDSDVDIWYRTYNTGSGSGEWTLYNGEFYINSTVILEAKTVSKLTDICDFESDISDPVQCIYSYSENAEWEYYRHQNLTFEIIPELIEQKDQYCIWIPYKLNIEYSYDGGLTWNNTFKEYKQYYYNNSYEKGWDNFNTVNNREKVLSWYKYKGIPLNRSSLTICVRGINSDNNVYNYPTLFYCQCKCNVYGNVASIVNFNTYTNEVGVAPNKLMNKAFAALIFTSSYTDIGTLNYGNNIIDCSNLVLPWKTLSNNCYVGMFSRSSITKPPKLPATILSNNCYNSMFSGCNNLVNAPELPATNLSNNCYDSMFRGCISITTAPELPATTLKYGCYSGMFMGCTSITTAPELPATGLGLHEYCYAQMFQDCSKLKNAPQLSSTYLYRHCYYGMFRNCTSLTTAPELPATYVRLGSYQHMFEGCTSLIIVPELQATLLEQSCYDSMFKGCTSLTAAPELPATTLINFCYAHMFEDCISLTSAPELLAEEDRGGYYSMFKGCINLQYIKCLSERNIDYLYWTYNVSKTGTFVKKAGVEWPTGNSGIPNGWTVIEV